MKALLKGIQLTSGGLVMFKEIDLGFMVGFGDSIGAEEIHGVGEGITKESSDERPDI